MAAPAPVDTIPLPESFDWTLAPSPVASGVAARPLAALQGRTTILFFFSPECGHCQEEWSHVVAAARGASSYNYQVGAIAASSTTRTDIEEFGKALGWDFPVWFDSTRALGNALNLRTVPRAILVRRDGSIAMFRKLDARKIRTVERLARLDAWR
jgi:thiol-disulfide isomerase/thioredoxin